MKARLLAKIQKALRQLHKRMRQKTHRALRLCVKHLCRSHALTQLLKWYQRQQPHLNTHARSANATDTGDVNLTVHGSASRSFLFAVRNLNIYTSWQIVAALALIGLALFVVLFSFGQRLDTLNLDKPELPKLSKGDNIMLDVAVLPFASSGGTADAACAQFAQKLSASLAHMTDERLKSPTQTQGLPGLLSAGIVIWRPEQIDVQTPTPGNATHDWMARFARDRGVDLVIYGLVDCADGAGTGTHDGNTIRVSPQFYVGPDYFKHAPELVGSYDFGAFSRAIDRTSDSTAMDAVRQELLDRAAAIVTLGQGFELYAHDKHADYLKAAEIFEAVLAAETIQDQRGLAMLHYMLGNAYMRSSTSDCGDILPDYMRLAEHHFLLAVNAEPEFASAYVGLGSIMSQWALASLGNPDVITGFLARGEAYYTHATNARISPAGANIVVRVMLSRAQARVIQHDMIDTNNTALLEEAEALLNQIILRFVAAEDGALAIRSTTAHAYSLLGDVYLQQDKKEAAQDAYYKAQQLAKDSKLRADIALRISDIATEASDACEAARQLQFMLDTVCVTDRADYVVRAQDAQYFCKVNYDLK